MTEGWYGDDYLVLFEQKAPSLERAYGLSEALPGYHLVGLRGWDDFIVEDSRGARFTVPTVPLLSRHLRPFPTSILQLKAASDEAVAGRIRWYITPVVFGGDPKHGDNVKWVTLDEHVQLVKWWNGKYREVSRSHGGTPAA